MESNRRLRRWINRTIGVGLIFFIAIQFVPYGWTKTNPAVNDPTPWPTQSAENIARSACYACHSNETEWPLYSYVAPFSWLVRRDVERGRDELNFSNWDDHDSEADDAIEEIEDDNMPPSQYRWIHRDAQLSDDEIDELIGALEQLDDE